MAGGGAAVPAEVVQLVADVRHRQLVDDPALVGVDDGEEVGRLDAGALVQADEIQEFLLRGVHRLLRRVVEGCWLDVSLVHGDSFQLVAVVRRGRSGRGPRAFPSSRSGEISAAARAAPSVSTGS